MKEVAAAEGVLQRIGMGLAASELKETIGRMGRGTAPLVEGIGVESGGSGR